LLQNLHSVTDPQRFLDHYAEAMVARHLIRNGCELTVEVPTVYGRTADFTVSKDNHTFFVHVKRLNVDEATQKEINIQKRLQDLKKIPRPVILAALFYRMPTDSKMREIYRQLKPFVKSAPIGKTIIFRNRSGELIAEFTIHSTHQRTHVQMIMTGSVKCVDDKARFYKKLSQAYKQFVPASLNIILVTSLWSDDIEDLETALFGTTFEVLGGIPPNLRVTESGRKPDGFWSAGKHPESYVASWFKFGTKDDYINFRMWYRDNYQVPSFIKDLFEKKI
jgi:hypothetical protein